MAQQTRERIEKEIMVWGRQEKGLFNVPVHSTKNISWRVSNLDPCIHPPSCVAHMPSKSMQNALDNPPAPH